MKPDLEEFEEGFCPSCGEELVDEEATRPVCRCCDARLERELAAYLEFVAAMRSRCRRQGRGCARVSPSAGSRRLQGERISMSQNRREEPQCR